MILVLTVGVGFGAVQHLHAQSIDWWKPTATQRIALHWVLEGALDVTSPTQMGLRDMNGNALPEPNVYDIDGEMNSAATVAYLHGKGKKVICYFDAGVYESYRTDAYRFQALSPRIWGNADEGWNDSFWLDVRRVDELEPIMKARMQVCKDKGFDAIEPDEIDGWENDTGFPITYQDQLNYNKALARWAHELGLSIGQKGDLIQVRDLVDDFDWTLNEECFQYNECTNPYDPYLDDEVPGLQLYVQRNKAVFIAEYKGYTSTKWNSICTNSTKNRFNTTRFKLGLRNNGGRMPCSTAVGW
ncbi:endo alpha-1,4 polygalactosaminidase [Lysobacter helvus]|uniref:endo alpha-1,4 polygalactosaminidase n=1 Tax=Lysobacter helvus TaxID=2675059 RepID=UPI001BD113BA|nr:endo alpha-1,4 polygalactosaminidase [Lysobacter helvus]